MDDDILPFIAEKDYEAFRPIIREDFPDTYDEWLKRHAQEKLERRGRGHTVKDIEVSPHEFAKFCRDQGKEGIWQHLLDFAITIAKSEPQLVKLDEDGTEDRED